MQFLDKLNEIFYEGMDRQTSAYLFGSATTGEWVAGRSDLDLFIFIPKEKLEILGQKVRAWSSKSNFPILDGYAAYFSGDTLVTIQLERLLKVTYPSNTEIELMDKWLIKNRAKYLFGDSAINNLVSDINLNQLKSWAQEQMNYLSKANPPKDAYDSTNLTRLIWVISYSARLLMLSKGNICESKQEALKWLSSEYYEIRELVNSLLDNYSKQSNTTSITPEGSFKLRKFCVDLMLQEVGNV